MHFAVLRAEERLTMKKEGKTKWILRHMEQTYHEKTMDNTRSVRKGWKENGMSGWLRGKVATRKIHSLD